MKKKINKARRITACFVVTWLFVLSLSAQAFDVSKVNMKKIELESISFNSGNVAKGNFVIDNNLKESVNLSYRISLLQGGKVFGEETFEVNEQIQPNESIKQEFKYEIPLNIKSGDYILKIQLFLRDGIALNWVDQEISIISNGIYLNITGSSILKNKYSFDSKMIIDFYSDEIPTISFLAYNPTNKIVTFKPHIILYSNQSDINELDNYFAEEMDLMPKKNENVIINLPQLQEPGSYFVKVDLASDDMSVSNIESFRWTVSKREARIMDVAVLDNIFIAGKENSVSIEFIGESGISEDENAELVFGVYDISERIIETHKRQITLSSIPKKEVFKIDISQSVKNLKIDARIFKNGKEVDSREGIFKVESNSKEKRESGGSINYILIILFAVISGLFIFLVHRFYKK